MNMPTLARSAHRSPMDGAPRASRWFLRFREVQRPRLKLFCLPYAGGSASVYRQWPAQLEPRIEVLALQLPGRGARLSEPPCADLMALADQVADAVRQEAAGVRFALFGHSMGALLAFEVTRRLAAQGRQLPECLFVSGRNAPHTGPGVQRRRRDMSDADFVEELRRLEGTPGDVLDNPELLALLMPALRGDFALLEDWVLHPSAPLDVPVVALAGRGDPHVGVETMQSWSDWTRERFELLTYGGGHFFIHDDERRVVRDVSDRLMGLLCG